MLLDTIVAVVGNVLDKVIPDPAQAADAKLKLLTLAQNGELAQLNADTQLAQGQLDVNKQEATNPSLFVSGWRPFVGWICGSGLGYAFLLKPIFSPFALKYLGAAMEPLDIGTLLTLLLGMLGLGGMRTYEKVTGVASSAPH